MNRRAQTALFLTVEICLNGKRGRFTQSIPVLRNQSVNPSIGNEVKGSLDSGSGVKITLKQRSRDN